MKSIHDPVPVVLPRDAECEWLSARPDARKELCRQCPKDDLNAYEISMRVNPRNDDPQIIELLDYEKSGIDEFS